MDIQFKDGNELSEEILSKIVEIDNAIPSEFDPEWQPKESEHQDRLAEYKSYSKSDFFKVAFFKDEVIGFHMILGKCGSQKNIGIITTLWVNPAYRKQGIGRQLKKMGITWARSLNLKCLQTTIHSNNNRMMEINLNHGFAPYAITLRQNI